MKPSCPSPTTRNLALRLFLLGCVGLFLSSCATSSPQSRIQERPDRFAKVSAKHQALAQQGQICEGMTKDGVWIAWGSPNAISKGADSGASFELWRYTAHRPVYTHSIGVGYGFGYYRRGRHCGGPIFDYDWGPVYVPYDVAEVKFVNGKVKSWQRAQ